MELSACYGRSGNGWNTHTSTECAVGQQRAHQPVLEVAPTRLWPNDKPADEQPLDEHDGQQLDERSQEYVMQPKQRVEAEAAPREEPRDGRAPIGRVGLAPFCHVPQGDQRHRQLCRLQQQEGGQRSQGTTSCIIAPSQQRSNRTQPHAIHRKIHCWALARPSYATRLHEKKGGQPENQVERARWRRERGATVAPILLRRVVLLVR